MEKKRKIIIFVITGIGLAIILASGAGYYVWQKRANETMRLEGQRYAEDYLASYIIRCGEGIYISTESQILTSSGLLPVHRLIQTESVKAIFALSNEPLTQAELKEDINAKGKLLVINGKNREYDFVRQKWEPWNDSDYKVDAVLGTPFYRTSTGWSRLAVANLGADFISKRDYGVANKPVACSDIPK